MQNANNRNWILIQGSLSGNQVPHLFLTKGIGWFGRWIYVFCLKLTPLRNTRSEIVHNRRRIDKHWTNFSKNFFGPPYYLFVVRLMQLHLFDPIILQCTKKLLEIILNGCWHKKYRQTNNKFNNKRENNQKCDCMGLDQSSSCIHCKKL